MRSLKEVFDRVDLELRHHTFLSKSYYWGSCETEWLAAHPFRSNQQFLRSPNLNRLSSFQLRSSSFENIRILLKPWLQIFSARTDPTLPNPIVQATKTRAVGFFDYALLTFQIKPDDFGNPE
ncbi:hypothetical protein FS842_000393 [Serendipita sp. 407]|nr:hypothetical protein FRC18_001420 [Serendipita sp. 400]KAG9048482.1 hypothetical protein FS842_000393 [Serendipita sp. 407]